MLTKNGGVSSPQKQDLQHEAEFDVMMDACGFSDRAVAVAGEDRRDVERQDQSRTEFANSSSDVYRFPAIQDLWSILYIVQYSASNGRCQDTQKPIWKHTLLMTACHSSAGIEPPMRRLVAISTAFELPCNQCKRGPDERFRVYTLNELLISPQIRHLK
jgi:hypothetical protein